jgi:outer membrane murein-binding lipoprotein Lpp
MKMSLDKKLMAGAVLGATLLSGCASVSRGGPDEALNQLSSYVNKTTELKSQPKALGNPLEYSISSLKAAYNGGFLHDLNNIPDFGLQYSAYSGDKKDLLLMAGISKTYPFSEEVYGQIGSCLKSSTPEDCSVSYKNSALDSRMTSYVGSNEYARSKEWLSRGGLGDDFSLALWLLVSSAMHNSGSSATSTEPSIGQNGSTSTVGNTISVGGSTAGNVSVGGTVF